MQTACPCFPSLRRFNLARVAPKLVQGGEKAVASRVKASSSSFYTGISTFMLKTASEFSFRRLDSETEPSFRIACKVIVLSQPSIASGNSARPLLAESQSV